MFNGQTMHVEDLLTQADQLENQRSHWSAIDTLLNDAKELAHEVPEAERYGLLGQVNAKRSLLTRRRKKAIDHFLQDIESDLARLNTSAALDQLRGDLQRTREQAVDPSEIEPRVRDLEIRAEQIYHDIEIQKKYQKASDELEQYWNQGEEQFRAEDGPPAIEIVRDYFETARNEAAALAAQYPDHSHFQQLAIRATQKHDEAREHANIATTIKQLNLYDEMLTKIEQADPDKYFEIPDEQDRVQRLRRDDAKQLVRRLQGRFNVSRANRYLDEVEHHLANHDPVQAQDAIDNARKLANLPDEMQGVINRRYDEKVKEPLARWDAATRVAQEARRASNLVEAWQKLLEAKSHYEWAVGIADASEELERRARLQLSERLKRVEQNIENAHEISHLIDAEADLKQIEDDPAFRNFLNDIDVMISPLRERINIIQQEKNALTAFRSDLEQWVSNKDFKQANQELRHFLDRYPNADNRDDRLLRLARRIRVYVEIASLPEWLDEAYRSNDRLRIQEALDDAKSARDNDPVVAKTHKIPDWQEKLEGRLKVIEAERFWTNDGMDNEALMQLQAVNRSQAAVEDRQRAQLLMEEIQLSQRRQQKLSDLLPHLRQLVDDEQYRPAFDLLKSPEDLMEAVPRIPISLARQRNEIWGRISEGLFQVTVRDLESLLTHDPTKNLKDLEDFVGFGRLLDDIGTRLNPAMERQVNERIAVLSALRSTQSEEWEKAQQYWAKAQAYNEVNADYQRAFRAARRRAVRAKLDRYGAFTDQITQAIQIAREYIQDQPEYIEPRVWYVQVLIAATRSATDPQLFDDGWRQANTVLLQAQNLKEFQDINFQKLAEEQQALQQLSSIQNQIEVGRKDAQELMQISRILTAKQELIMLRSATQRIELFLENHSDYAGIEQWWHDRHRPNMQNELEGAARSHQHEYWQSFADYARLLVIVPNHEEAQKYVRQVSIRITELLGFARAQVDDYIGIVAEPKTFSVKQQIAEIEKVKNYVETALMSLRFFEDLFADNQVVINDASSALEAVEHEIDNKIRQLNNLNEQFGAALDISHSLGRTGKWKEFDLKLTEIRKLYDGKYSEHILFNIADERKQKYIDERRHLEEIISHIRQHFSQQRLADLKGQLSILEERDPGDDYNLQTSVDFLDPRGKRAFDSIAELKEWLMEAEEQHTRVRAWLEPLVRSALMDESFNQDFNTLLEMQVNLEHGRKELYIRPQVDYYVVYWADIQQQVDSEIHKADFGRAYQFALSAIGKGSDFPSPDRTSGAIHYKLQPSVEYLRLPSQIRRDEALSMQTSILLLIGEMLRSQLEESLQAARSYLNSIETDARQFIDWLTQFDAAYKSVMTRRDTKSVAEAQRLHQELSSRFPDYDGLYAPEFYPNLQTKS